MVELEGETDPLQIAMKELKYVLFFITFLCNFLQSLTKISDSLFSYSRHT